jgi:hypothetical protein
MTHGEQADPIPGRWYRTVIDWPYDGCVVWARRDPWFSTPFKATWASSSSRFYHSTFVVAATWIQIESWSLYDGP